MPDADKGHPLSKNPNWSGGRTVTDHGYVLVKQPEHPDADVRGYIYEHRLVAEEKLGRRLKSDEQVHHKNGDKQDNAPGNLEVLSAVEHRKRHQTNDERRDPDEPNPTIECACGGGARFSKYDDSGRPRKYISGHNPQRRPTQEALLNALNDGPKKREALIERVGKTQAAVAAGLTNLQENGEVANPKRGMWALPEDAGEVDTERQENPTVTCACGCGETFPKYDEYGRPRDYISGHNTESSVRDGVLNELAQGPMKRATLADNLGKSRNSVGTTLRRLRDDGIVKKADGWGMWKLAGKSPNEVDADE